MSTLKFDRHHSTCGNRISKYPIIIAVTQRNMEVRFATRAPGGSLAFGFASPLVRAFGASESEKLLGPGYVLTVSASHENNQRFM